MKSKIIIALLIVLSFFLFSMQLCSLIFGNKPVVAITSPINNATISGTTLTVSGTISDLDGDQTKVKVWIEDTSVVGWDNGVTSGIFEVTLALSGMTDRTYYLMAEGYDSNNNVSDKYTINLVYSSSGGGTNTAPTFVVTSPTDNQYITTSTLTITGTITDTDGDGTFITAWIDGYASITDTYNLTPGQTSQDFTLNLDLSSLSNMTYYIKIYARDANNNESAITTITFNLSKGTTNFIQNGNFTSYYDNYSGFYTTQELINTYLNKTNGDYLYNWQFYIWSQYALDNEPGIYLNGNQITLFSNVSDGDGNAKIMMMQNINHVVTAKTKIYIKFIIDQFFGGTNPSDAPIKIAYNGSLGNSGTTFAAYSTNSGTSNGKNYVSSLNYGQSYAFDFYLSSDAGIPIGTTFYNIIIWVNGWMWDATIYEIKLYEEP